MNPIKWFRELRYVVRNYSFHVRRLKALEEFERQRDKHGY